MADSIGVTMATSKTTTSTTDRLDNATFDKLIESIRKDGIKAESSIQRGFMAAWCDHAASHSVERLERLWQVLTESKSPFKAQISTAIHALAGRARPVRNSQKWERTGKQPLS